MIVVTLWLSAVLVAAALVARSAGRRSSPSVRFPSERVTRSLVYAAMAWTVVLGGFWLFAPVVDSASATVSASGSASGTTSVTTSTETLLESEGAGIVVVIMVPATISLVAVLAVRARRRRTICITAGSLIGVGSLLGAMTVGLPYMPAALLLVLAGVRTPSWRRRGPARSIPVLSG